MKLFEAVEVGTDCGDFAFSFLSAWDGRTLICIDPYEPYHEMMWDRTMDMIMAAVRLAPFGWRVKFIRDHSPKAIEHLPQGRQIDFVYIDGNHTGFYAARDVEAWWFVLEPGGILAGHDYCAATPDVVAVVNHLAERAKLDVYVIDDPIFAPSWYIFKPKKGERQP